MAYACPVRTSASKIGSDKEESFGFLSPYPHPFCSCARAGVCPIMQSYAQMRHWPCVAGALFSVT